MKKYICSIGLLLFSQLALAAEISGVVRDYKGSPIGDAVVEVVSANLRATTNPRGEFALTNLPRRDLELHIQAPGYMHQTLHVSAEDSPLTLVLNRVVMEVIDVVGLPWHASSLESSTPVNVLAGERLRRQQAPTLGDSLGGEVGVHSNYYGPVSSSPVIRGLEGPRVLITQNSLDAGDASRVGPDHAVSTEASTARQIEVLRGPATLMYGSGAIGGVVNIVDSRVPVDGDTSGEWLAQYSSVADEKLVSGNINLGTDRVGFYADGFWREAGEYKIPGPAEAGQQDRDGHGHQRLENSDADSWGLSLGGSYFLDNGYLGISYGRLERRYGIPGHAHDEGHDDHDDEGVFADVEQDRLQLISELSLNNPLVSSVNTRLGYTDYWHAEVEDGEIGTVFENKTREARVDINHHPLAHWRGKLSLHYKQSDFAAEGLEAFTPASVTDSFALALLEERHFGDLLIQLGARVERVEISADRLILNPDAHDIGGEDHHGHDHQDHESGARAYAVDHRFSPFSLSAGAVWDFAPGYNVGVSLTHAQRAPSASELLSFGPHIATGAFEVGALFALHDDGEHDPEFILSDSDIELEGSNNIDLSLRRFEGDIGFILNAFFNDVDNFYYLQSTGLYAEDPHDDHGHHGHDDDHDRMPVFLYLADGVRLYGLEGQFVWQVMDPVKLTLMADSVRARLKDGDNLPRVPPRRIGGELAYQRGNYSAGVTVSRYFSQRHTAELETPTDGYTLLDAHLDYRFVFAGMDMTLYLQGSNLTDEHARVHSSFIKDLAPLPGRSLALGVRSRF